MAQAQYVKHLWEEDGKSLREISRITGLCFQTVQKYAYMDDWTPKTHSIQRATKHYPVLGPHISILNRWLEEDLREPRKQRHTVKRMYIRLKEEHGFLGSYECVKDYVRAKKKTMSEGKTKGFLPLAQVKAHTQLDFGQFKYYDKAGNAHTGHALTLSFPYSNAAYTQVLPGENQECLLEGLKRIFTFIGGIPTHIKTDNMSAAVVQVLKDGERILTDGFTRFMLHYRFKAEFCSPCAGNQKGHVENYVGYTRRNFFVPVPIIEDFEVYNNELFERCKIDMNRPHYKHKRLISSLWQEESLTLLSLPESDYQVFRYANARINNYGCVEIDNNYYGVSPELAGETATIKVFYDRIEISHEHSLLKTYTRSYERNKEFLDWKQYIGLMQKKPGGVIHARFFNQLPKLWQEHIKNSNRQEKKTALLLLQEIIREGNENLCDEVISFARECGRSDIESIRQCYYMISRSEYHPQPIPFSSFIPDVGYNPNLNAYDCLTGGVING